MDFLADLATQHAADEAADRPAHDPEGAAGDAGDLVEVDVQGQG